MSSGNSLQASVNGPRAVPGEPDRSASELLQRTLEMDDRMAQRTAELEKANADLRAEILARQTVEHRLREQAQLLDQANEAIITVTGDQRIDFWNRGAERLLGWTAAESQGRPLREIFTLIGPGGSVPAGEVFRADQDWRGELTATTRGGENRICETGVTRLTPKAGSPAGWLIISTDVTETKKLQERFLRAQRLESVGMLAAGIAHDINNAIAPVGIVASLLRSRLTAPSDVRWLDTLEKSVVRCSGLVRQILGFAHGIGGELRVLQVRHLLRDIAAVIAQTFPKSILLKEDFPRDLWTIKAQVTQIQQVVLNLCVNARDAMPDGGRLFLKAENCRLDAAAAQAIPGGRPGAWLVLHVEDSGTGIPPEVLARIWDPFYTTKSADKGTGLGLSTVRGIVETHHGFIHVTTAPGRGSTFRVYLPAADAAAEDAPKEAAVRKNRGRGECILVVDDEEPNRESLREILEANGYWVVTAADGGEAVKKINLPGAAIALVITDYEMPVMHGEGLTRIIRAQHEEIKVLMISGSNRMFDIGCHAKLLKPYSAEELLRVVDELLHPEPAGAPVAGVDAVARG